MAGTVVVRLGSRALLFFCELGDHGESAVVARDEAAEGEVALDGVRRVFVAAIEEVLDGIKSFFLGKRCVRSLLGGAVPLEGSGVEFAPQD